MTWSRFFGASTAVLAVGGCAVVAVGMANADRRIVHSTHSTHRGVVVSSRTEAVYAPVTFATPRARIAPRRTHQRPSTPPSPTTLSATAAPLHQVKPAPKTTPAANPSHAPAPAATPDRTATPSTSSRPSPTRASTSASTPTRTRHAAAAARRPRGTRLPLHFRTHHARQVITVVAHSRGSTTATLQAWRKLRDGRWLRRGPRIHAHIGADGMTWHASESKSATPMGSFTLTHAFGHDTDPGTALPYLHTNPSDWWISQPGRLYNTHQRCARNCPFTQGAPNEHLYYETPYYNYAVVIDYNTRNAPGGVRQGKGSAFFLHVTVGQPTAGCVAIPQRRLISIMRWLAPRKHPRILMGVG